jgi:hypothetical protein
MSQTNADDTFRTTDHVPAAANTEESHPVSEDRSE